MAHLRGHLLIFSAVLPALFLAFPAAGAEPKIPVPSGADTFEANPDVAEMVEQLEEDPLNAQLYGDLGNLYASKGWYDLAAASYRQAVKLDKQLYSAWANMGTVYIKMEEFEDAEDAFQRALAIQPRDALAHYNLGVAQDRGGNYENALQSYRTAILYDPELLDPAVNPQVVNNAHMTSIQLMAYLDDIGTRTLPLAEMPAPVMAEPGEKPILGKLIMREEPRPSTGP